MKNKNQSQAGVNRHTSSEEVEMVKHSPDKLSGGLE